MNKNNLEDLINFRPTKQQKEAFEKLKSIGYNRSELIRISIDEYFKKNFNKLIESTKEKCPF
jgi:hypothetical protein